MQSRIILLFILVSASISTVSAQYTESINNNRPGGSQGAFAVGKNVLQFEGGFGLGKEKHRLLFTETDAILVDYSVRYGLIKEELEISVIGTFQSNSFIDTRITNANKQRLSNFKSNTVGAKYLVYDPYRKRQMNGPNLQSWKANNKTQWADLIPAISIYAGANFEFADNPFTPQAESSINPKLVLSTQNNFIGGFVLITNIIADRITEKEPTYGYIITITHAPTEWFSLFVENQGFKSDFYADQLFRGGASVLITPDWQVDASVLLNIKDTPSRLFGRIGMAYRFDMHEKDEYLENKGKAGRETRRSEKGKVKKLKKQKKDNQKRRKDGFQTDPLEDDGGDDGGLN
ncbi:MAG: hypothetical protein ACI86C_001595 [Candidatus Latescibacterota bacterium]|jgi:hypothetical protein